MAGRDHSLALRQVLVTLLRDHKPLTDLVGQRIYGEKPAQDVQWPYVMIGTMIVTPYTPSGVAGGRPRGIVHCFARGPGADDAYKINAVLVRHLDGLRPAQGDMTARISVELSQVIADAAAQADWHGIVSINATTAEAA